MKKIIVLCVSIGFGLILLASPVTVTQCCGSSDTDNQEHNKNAVKKTEMKTTQATIYVCPMHPEVKSDKPGNCPKCGMVLKKKTVSSSKEYGKIQATKKNINKLKGIKSEKISPVVYTCPMHPEVTADKPGRCPKCGMNLEKK